MKPKRHFPHPGRWTPLALALAAALASGLVLAESATTLRATPMHSEPLGSADVVAKLGAKAPVDITQRQGAWAGVTNAEGLDGWVRILNLRTGTSDGNAKGGGNQLAAAFLTGSSGNDVSTGVKGLSPDKLRNAGAAPGEVAWLEQLAAQPDDARLFAMSASLEAHQVDYPKEKRRKRRNQR